MARTHRYDMDLVRSATAARWPEILSALGGVSVDILNGKHHPCPKCGGTDRFRMIDRQAGALMCNQCFRDRNGDGFAALQWLCGWDFKETIERVAEFVGVKPKKGKAKPDDDLEFVDWNDDLVAMWCDRKPPIKPDAIKSIGGRLARYRNQFTVVAIPTYSQANIVGWTIYNVTGGTVPKFANGKTQWVKVKVTYGSSPGLIGTIEKLGQGETWKTEGPTDVLALLSAAPDATVVCNAHGATEKPGEMAEQFRGCGRVNVVHDCDRPGQEGASRWCLGLTQHVGDVRNVVLPFELVESHGQDLRDYLADHAFGDLVQLANDTAPLRRESIDVIECDKDPHRLARVNLEKYKRIGRTLKFWREEWFSYRGTHYQKISKAELRAKVCATIREEFLRIYRESVGTKDELKHPECVSRSLVSDTIAAMESTQVLSGWMEPGTFCDDDRQQKDWIAVQNGILDVNRLLDGQDGYLMPHDDRWWSMTCLPFEFDVDASCDTWQRVTAMNLDGDHERIALLQEWAGYLLLPETGLQKFMIVEGEGSNGKSVFCAGIEAMLGQENVAGISLENFGDRFSRTDTLGKLVNIVDDVGELDRPAEGLIKSYVGGKPMFFDRKGLPGITKVPTARLMIACNNRPRWADKSKGIWRRMIVVPFLREIQDNEKVHNMDKAWWWQKQGEAAGIFSWSLAGLARLRQRNGRFTESKISKQAHEEYQIESNPAREFLSENYEMTHDGESEFTQDMYSDYREWCKANGYSALGEHNFGREVKRFFVGSTRVRRSKTPTERKWAYSCIRKKPDSCQFQ